MVRRTLVGFTSFSFLSTGARQLVNKAWLLRLKGKLFKSTISCELAVFSVFLSSFPASHHPRWVSLPRHSARACGQKRIARAKRITRTGETRELHSSRTKKKQKRGDKGKQVRPYQHSPKPKSRSTTVFVQEANVFLIKFQRPAKT